MPDDTDPTETREWLDAFEYVIKAAGPERAAYLLERLEQKAFQKAVPVISVATTPYVNTIPLERQPQYPGNRSIERKIKSIIRWNAMAMVVRANKDPSLGIGGHISTFASAATLYEVAFNHFFQGKSANHSGDQVYFQGHASPGIYARAFLEGRLSEQHLVNFRRELAPGGGLSSYPHPWLMPDFWQFPTVSMGLGPIMAIYQARFNRYLQNRGLLDTSQARVWAFLGDGECDEPETLGAITLASREMLDNLTFVINCNLQRLDGPVRGNGKIIQELEGAFHGAGWNVIKVIWGSDWDELLARDKTGLLIRRMGETLDGEYQKYTVSDGAYIRKHFFGKYPELLELVKDMSDEDLRRLKRGGHDPDKVYAAYKAAVGHKGQPTCVIAHTIKGYGLGESGEGRNITHNLKKANDEELKRFRIRFDIPISEVEVVKAPFYKPEDDSPEMKYLHERRKALGGYLPKRTNTAPPIVAPKLEDYKEFLTGSGERDVSTTSAFGALLQKLLRDKEIGKNLVPIIPDEARTFGMESLFRQCGIYAHRGQLYDPVDSEQLLYYREEKNGQLLEEGITEAGSMCSFIAAGTAHTSHGINMIPFFTYYSMFGFQRIGDLVWAAADLRCRGFMMGGTSGRTTLAGEGLQHQDGHSHLLALPVPTCWAYDPAYAYEISVLVLDGIRRMWQDQEDIFYYITIHNENYVQPPMPAGVEEGIVKGIYKLSTRDVGNNKPRVQLFGSGAILRETLRAQEILATKYDVSSDVWSVTSYKALRNDARECQRQHMHHPNAKPQVSYIEQVLSGVSGPFIAASDNVKAIPEQIAQWIPGDYFVLGTDGFGRSEGRKELRRFFEVDAEYITLAALYRLAFLGQVPATLPGQALVQLGLDPEKPNPLSM